MQSEVRLVEPSNLTFDEHLLALVHELCDDARRDDRSPRYLLAIPDHQRVERVRCMVNELGAGRWDDQSSQLQLCNGQFVAVGGRSLDQWPFERAVVVCSGDFPSDGHLVALLECGSVVFVIDPNNRPMMVAELRALARRETGSRRASNG